MTKKNVLYCLLLLTLLDATLQIRSSLHGHNNAFVQDDNDVQYLLDNMPISMHKDFPNTVHGVGDTPLDEDKMEDSFSHISFEPTVLDFKERQLGIPHQETVIMFNKDHNKTIHLSSISGNTRHFHSSFFQNKVIPPLGNTTFNVIFLGRDEGDIDTHLFIHTSDGTLKYQVKGISVSSPYRLRPVVDVKLPLNASFTPLIYMHNPHPEALQVVEVYSSGGEFQLELPSGEPEGSRDLWEILPFQTKPIIRLRFNAYAEKNHTAYVRFKVNNTAEILVVAVEVEVKSGAGLHWGGSSGVINLGMGGSLQPPIRHPIALKNSAKKAIKVVNIINTPVSKALKLHFEPAIIPGETDIPIAIGMLVYDWKTGLDLQHFKGKLIIKAIGPGGSSQKLAIPWVAQVLQGGLEVNTSITHYCSLQSNQARNFSVVNKFKLPLAITNVTMCSNAKSLFTIKDFTPRIIKPDQKVNIFSLQLAKERKGDNVKMETSILIHSNVSVTEVPLLSYDGKVRKVMPGEKDDTGTMNFGTVGSGTENEAIFALENQNPVNVELHDWGVNMPGAVLELMGCQSGPVDLLDKEFRNITVCSHSGNQYIKPGFLAIFKIKVKTSMIEEDTIVGDVFVRTTYERFTLPVYMRVAHGKISLKKLIFTDCFPGSICVQQVKIHSTFSRPMEITHIAPINKNDRIKYIPLEEATMPVISKGGNNVGSIQIDSLVTCKQHCYLGLPMESNIGSQWLNTMNLPSHTRDSDLNLLNTRYMRFLNSTADDSWDNVTMRLDTTEVRGHKFYINIKPFWPNLLTSSSNIKNKSVLMFPLTQVGNTSYRTIKLHNPSMNPLIVQLVMDWSYPQGVRLYHSLPMKFKSVCVECLPTVPEEFKLEENADERRLFEKQWGVSIAPQSVPLYLYPAESRMIRIAYTPFFASMSSGFLYIRNNMTILEVLRLTGRGASAQFRFDNRKPGSIIPLLFELTDKHFKNCERQRGAITVKRSFVVRNTGELSIEIYGFEINGLPCEGYGFKILNCAPFKLNPNATKTIEIAFTPDFTLSRVERKLFVLTNIWLNSGGKDTKNNVMTFNLLAILPTHLLDLCASTLIRPFVEQVIHWGAIIISIVLFLCVVLVSFIEADRILCNTITGYKNSTVQPPFDLRHLSDSTIQISSSGGSGDGSGANKNEKIVTSDEKSKTRKDEAFPDWTLMNVKKCKDKDSQRGLKIPDWSVEEERKFKLDTESKDLLSFKRCDELSNMDNASAISTVNISGSKKKNKKQNITQEAISDSATNDTPTDTQASQEKKCIVTMTKSSPMSSRKGKAQSSTQPNVKEESKLIDEIHMDAGIIIGRTSKMDNKRNKQSSGNNKEETSSTTTESSIHDETTLCKSFDQSYGKQEKPQRKPISKKSKSQSISTVPCVECKDNYEDDCDDDEYDKEKQNDPNKWKTTKSTTKHQMHTSRTVESSSKLPRQNKNLPRKEKFVQKRRGPDKTHVKTLTVNWNVSQKEDITRTGTISIPSTPPSSCWGENRAKFSDVVARNQEIASTSNLSHVKSQTSTSNLSTMLNIDTKDAKAQLSQELLQTPKEYNLMSKSGPSLCIATEKDKTVDSDPLLLQSDSQHSNSYFSSFTEHPQFERELIPYDDLPDTDEPLVELETPEEDTRLWQDTSSMNLLSDNTKKYQMESSKVTNQEKSDASVASDLKDNWVVDTNWEPYTKAAVGEERSGFWGVNTGGVWAAGPWGAAATPPIISSPLQPESDVQERSGFDPFRSLSTIWTPSSTESWRLEKHED